MEKFSTDKKSLSTDRFCFTCHILSCDKLEMFHLHVHKICKHKTCYGGNLG